MLGLNNLKEKQSRQYNQCFRYCIKKLSIGVVSCAVASCFAMNSIDSVQAEGIDDINMSESKEDKANLRTESFNKATVVSSIESENSKLAINSFLNKSEDDPTVGESLGKSYEDKKESERERKTENLENTNYIQNEELNIPEISIQWEDNSDPLAVAKDIQKQLDQSINPYLQNLYSKDELNKIRSEFNINEDSGERRIYLDYKDGRKEFIPFSVRINRNQTKTMADQFDLTIPATVIEMDSLTDVVGTHNKIVNYAFDFIRKNKKKKEGKLISEILNEEALTISAQASGKNTVKVNFIDGSSKELTFEAILAVLDSDGDGLPDYLEEHYRTNKFKIDTDDDQLTDFIEISRTFTNPLLADTDGNGVPDASEDSDKDGLTNIEEVETYQTNPGFDDSDYDGLKDGEEVKIHHTDPFKVDTDGDGASDGWEVKHGANPTTFDHLLKVSESFKDDRGVTVTVTSKLPGQKAEKLKINKVNNLLLPETLPGLMSNPVSVNMVTPKDFANIKFEFELDIQKNEDGSYVTPTIYSFNESLQSLEEVNTRFSLYPNKNGKLEAVAKLLKPSTYLLADKTQVHLDKQYIWDDVNFLKDNPNIIFTIDTSKSMDWNDKNNDRYKFINELVTSIQNDKAIKNGIGVVTFDDTAEIKVDMNLPTSRVISFLNENKTNNGGTELIEGLQISLNQFEYLKSNQHSENRSIILLTDGVAKISDNSKIIDLAKEKAVKIYVIALANVDKYNDILRDIAHKTGGLFFYATDISDLNILGEQLKYNSKDSNRDGISDNIIRAIIKNKSKSKASLVRTGLNVYEEFFKDFVEKNIEKQNPTDEEILDYLINDLPKDMDKDGLLNGEELITVNDETGSHLKVDFDPNSLDSDMDGVIDSNDEEPLYWNIGDRDLAIMAQLAYLSKNEYENLKKLNLTGLEKNYKV
ncbi:VWA domain-containing protein [Aerococcus sp. UMB1112A]|uniref:vWA domain-containing protein n=1 Tax=Aerococcus sp. UMB1112A TaxID=3050609 RepID=UPI00254EDB4B|nr:vWA domain-containing protein [Aerococcus sp. UMB1112A]MDK8501552.1 VWA domain-containing protein [Aerococcus sp. UMB1112A]